MTPTDTGAPRILRRLSHVVARRIRESGVLVNLRTNDIFELNDSAMRVWELLEVCDSQRSIAAQLVAEFEVEPEVAERETVTILARFEQQGVVGS